MATPIADDTDSESTATLVAVAMDSKVIRNSIRLDGAGVEGVGRASRAVEIKLFSA